MSDTENTDLQMPSEKDSLLQRAKLMGLSVSNNASVATLKAKIAEHEAAVDAAANAGSDTSGVNGLESLAPAKPDTSPLREAAPGDWKQALRLDKLRLIRCRIQNMDPKDKDLKSELFCVANGVLGTLKHVVPYADQAEDGWHVPKWLLDEIKSKEFLSIRTQRNRQTGQIEVKQTMVKKYVVEILDPLTTQELARLRTAQAAAAGGQG